MEKWDIDAGCPKCGMRDLMTRWFPETEEHQVDGRLFRVGRPSPRDLRTVSAKPERLEVVCRRCGYGWTAEPISTEADRCEVCGGHVRADEWVPTSR